MPHHLLIRNATHLSSIPLSVAASGPGRIWNQATTIYVYTPRRIKIHNDDDEVAVEYGISSSTTSLCRVYSRANECARSRKPFFAAYSYIVSTARLFGKLHVKKPVIQMPRSSRRSSNVWKCALLLCGMAWFAE